MKYRKEVLLFDDRTRPLKDRILAPVAGIVPQKLHPTTITLFSLVPGLAAAAFAASGSWITAFVLFLLNRILDGLDGYIARSRRLQSDLGGYIDLMVDFVVYAAIPIGVWWGADASHTVSLIALLAVFYINAASWMVLSAIIEKRGFGEEIGTTVAMPSGMVEGTETLILYSLFLLLPHQFALLSALMIVGTCIGIVQRLLWAHRTL